MNVVVRAEAAPPIRLDRREGIAILTLCNPAARNPLSSATIASIRAMLDLIARDPAMRVLIIAADGPAFSAGHDLKEIARHREDADRGRSFFETLLADCSAMMLQLMRLPQPVIAAVEGVATAAGCQLVATSDLAIAGSKARFATPGVHIGLFCSTPMVALSRAVGRKAAMEMLLLGEMADAETALRVGLVNEVAPEGQALTRAMELARRIAAKPATTLKIGKEAFYRQAEMTIEDAYRHASAVMTENMLHRDAIDGIAGFLGKRSA
jgi:enoyl-CoA hydratase/carnithine racemase